jgi:putative endonuclease
MSSANNTLPPEQPIWWLYLLQCDHGLTYTGTTNDVDARFAKHQTGRGAKFTRINKPLSILGAQPFPNRSTACQAEYRLKKLKPQHKMTWAKDWPWPPEKP